MIAGILLPVRVVVLLVEAIAAEAADHLQEAHIQVDQVEADVLPEVVDAVVVDADNIYNRF